MDEEGREVIVLDLEGSRDQVSAKQLIARLSDEFGLSLDIPWNFIPEQLVLYSRRSDTVSEALSVESKVAPPPLSCPKCNGLLPCGLGEINCTLCDARVRVDHAAPTKMGAGETLLPVLLNGARCGC